MNMFKHIVFRIIAGLVLLAAIAGLTFLAYQAGAAHSLAANIQTSGAQAPGSPYTLYGMPYRHLMGFPGFGLFGVLFAIFLVFLAFGALRRLIWGPGWGWRHMGHYPMVNDPMGRHGTWGGGVPPMFAEMHRRAHATPDWDKAPESKEKE
jgi:hypothetical protein